MAFTSLKFIQFRNLSSKTISLDSREIFLVGENGQGKTNFLEAIYWLSYGSSFRTKGEKRITAHGFQEHAVIGQFSSDWGEHKISVQLSQGKKRIQLDGQIIRDRKEIIRFLPCIAFAHEDFLFINGPPEYQRQFFDQTLGLFAIPHIEVLRKYKKSLKTRTLLLQGKDEIALDTLDEQLVEYGVQIQRRRKELIEEFAPVFSRLVGEILEIPDFSLVYLPSWKQSEPQAIKDLLASRRETDRQTHRTNTGPHRDRFQFQAAGKNYAEYASTGQVRLLSLVLRVAQAVFFREKSGRDPILLLDDVLLELDPEKRSRFIARLPQYRQAFFTFLPQSGWEHYSAETTRVYNMQGGELTPWQKMQNV